MTKIFKTQNNLKFRKGFAVLFSVLLASFLITLGISIFTISLKEIQIATSARDSQTAYYVADSARECALYWDVKKGVFPTCLDSGNPCTQSTSSNPQVTCNGTQVTLPFLQNGLTFSTRSADGLSNIFTNFFQASSTFDGSAAADLRLTKTWNPGSNRITTKIEVWGHNTKILGRRVERGIQQTNNF